MTKYHVVLTKTVTKQYTVQVEAESEEDAEQFIIDNWSEDNNNIVFVEMTIEDDYGLNDRIDRFDLVAIDEVDDEEV